MGSFKVIIVGAGLSGALLTNGLINNGVECMLYERDQAEAKRREGYQIRLGPGSLAGFRACLTKEHIDKISAKLGHSSHPQGTAPTIYNTQFSDIIDLSLVPTYAKSSAINRIILRDLLLEPIIKNQRIQWGKAFDHYETFTGPDNVERVKVFFSDGSHDVCDVLVGADGSKSKVNKQLGLNNVQTLTTHWCFLSKGNLPYDRMMALTPKLRDGPFLVMSKENILYYAVYLSEAETVDQDHQGSDTKERTRHNKPAASFYWSLNVPVDSLPYKSASEIQNHKQICLDAIKDWSPQFHRMLNVGDEDPESTEIIVTQFRASEEPKANWRAEVRKAGNDKGHPRVWIIGDAIHAMQPTRGQGGNQALADCADMLPQLLYLDSLASIDPARLTFEELERACNKYEKPMMARAFRWVRTSGGLSFPSVNLDGFLGTLARSVAKVVVPLLKFYYRLVGKKEEE